MSDNDNMQLWNAVWRTNPDHTKEVNTRGGFTAVDAQSQVLAATEQFGPYGQDWGLYDLNWSLIQVEGMEPCMILDCLFRYPQGEFPISVDMPFDPRNECRKKLRTQAQSKALSLLGFNADIFMGKFEDDRYLTEVKSHFADEDELRETIVKAISVADTAQKQEKVKSRLADLFTGGSISKATHSEMLERLDNRINAPAVPEMTEEEKNAILEEEAKQYQDEIPW